MRPSVLFTDGAVEGEDFEHVTVGAVLIDPRDGFVEFFGCRVVDSILSERRAFGHRQVVGQAELFPFLLARQVWRQRMRERKLLAFLDNDAAWLSLAKGDSPSMAGKLVLAAVAREDASWPVPTWFSRVPSESNIADGPSRLDAGEVKKLFPSARECHPAQPHSLWELADRPHCRATTDHPVAVSLE